jgi:hypothetical protein
MDHLRGDPVAELLLPAAKRHLELQATLKMLLGEFLTDFSILQFDTGTLVVGVKTPSMAGKMRQSLPRLREGLLSRGWQINVIQLRVQPGISPAKSEAWGKKKEILAVPESALVHWEQLAACLEESPLRQAVHDLLMRRQHERMSKLGK